MTTPTPQRTANRDRWTALALFLGPLVMLAGLVSHPFMPTLGPEAVNRTLPANETQWFVSHLLIAIGSGLLAVSFLALRRLLQTHSDDPSSAWALPFTIVGSALFVLPPGMELGMLAAYRGGADIIAAQSAMDVFFLPIMMTSNLLFLIGAIGFARGIRHAHVVGNAASWTVAAMLLVTALVRFIPSGIQFYVGAAAGVIALWPLAVVAWQRGAQAADRRARVATTG